MKEKKESFNQFQKKKIDKLINSQFCLNLFRTFVYLIKKSLFSDFWQAIAHTQKPISSKKKPQPQSFAQALQEILKKFYLFLSPLWAFAIGVVSFVALLILSIITAIAMVVAGFAKIFIEALCALLNIKLPKDFFSYFFDFSEWFTFNTAYKTAKSFFNWCGFGQSQAAPTAQQDNNTMPQYQFDTSKAFSFFMNHDNLADIIGLSQKIQQSLQGLGLSLRDLLTGPHKQQAICATVLELATLLSQANKDSKDERAILSLVEGTDILLGTANTSNSIENSLKNLLQIFSQELQHAKSHTPTTSETPSREQAAAPETDHEWEQLLKQCKSSQGALEYLLDNRQHITSFLEILTTLIAPLDVFPSLKDSYQKYQQELSLTLEDAVLTELYNSLHQSAPQQWEAIITERLTQLNEQSQNTLELKSQAANSFKEDLLQKMREEKGLLENGLYSLLEAIAHGQKSRNFNIQRFTQTVLRRCQFLSTDQKNLFCSLVIAQIFPDLDQKLAERLKILLEKVLTDYNEPSKLSEKITAQDIALLRDKALLPVLRPLLNHGLDRYYDAMAADTGADLSQEKEFLKSLSLEILTSSDLSNDDLWALLQMGSQTNEHNIAAMKAIFTKILSPKQEGEEYNTAFVENLLAQHPEALMSLISKTISHTLVPPTTEKEAITALDKTLQTILTRMMLQSAPQSVQEKLGVVAQYLLAWLNGTMSAEDKKQIAGSALNLIAASDIALLRDTALLPLLQSVLNDGLDRYYDTMAADTGADLSYEKEFLKSLSLEILTSSDLSNDDLCALLQMGSQTNEHNIAAMKAIVAKILSPKQEGEEYNTAFVKNLLAQHSEGLMSLISKTISHTLVPPATEKEAITALDKTLQTILTRIMLSNGSQSVHEKLGVVAQHLLAWLNGTMSAEDKKQIAVSALNLIAASDIALLRDTALLPLLQSVLNDGLDRYYDTMAADTGADLSQEKEFLKSLSLEILTSSDLSNDDLCALLQMGSQTNEHNITAMKAIVAKILSPKQEGEEYNTAFVENLLAQHPEALMSLISNTISHTLVPPATGKEAITALDKTLQTILTRMMLQSGPQSVQEKLGVAARHLLAWLNGTMSAEDKKQIAGSALKLITSEDLTLLSQCLTKETQPFFEKVINDWVGYDNDKNNNSVAARLLHYAQHSQALTLEQSIQLLNDSGNQSYNQNNLKALIMALFERPQEGQDLSFINQVVTQEPKEFVRFVSRIMRNVFAPDTATPTDQEEEAFTAYILGLFDGNTATFARNMTLIGQLLVASPEERVVLAQQLQPLVANILEHKHTNLGPYQKLLDILQEKALTATKVNPRWVSYATTVRSFLPSRVIANYVYPTALKAYEYGYSILSQAENTRRQVVAQHQRVQEQYHNAYDRLLSLSFKNVYETCKKALTHASKNSVIQQVGIFFSSYLPEQSPVRKLFSLR